VNQPQQSYSSFGRKDHNYYTTLFIFIYTSNYVCARCNGRKYCSSRRRLPRSYHHPITPRSSVTLYWSLLRPRYPNIVHRHLCFSNLTVV
jgi:hypothetical protein